MTLRQGSSGKLRLALLVVIFSAISDHGEAFQIRRSTRYDASTNRQENPMPIVVQEAVKRPNQSKDLYRLLRTLKRSDPAAASVTAPWASLRQKWLLHHMTKLNRRSPMDTLEANFPTSALWEMPSPVRRQDGLSLEDKKLFNELLKLKTSQDRLYPYRSIM